MAASFYVAYCVKIWYGKYIELLMKKRGKTNEKGSYI